MADSYGATHEIPNLWVAEPGIFPTSGAPNPTYTIFALSLRGAENLAKNWGTFAGWLVRAHTDKIEVDEQWAANLGPVQDPRT